MPKRGIRPASPQPQPCVKLKAQGWQEGFGSLPGRMLFNVVAGDYEHGSTVTLETMQRRGFTVEIVE